eukprot:g2423.t1
MHIKQVIVSGFKSYRDTLRVDPFSPRHNLIVGRNGSGKSNFFDAIMFVLGDGSSNMRVEHRKKLLYDEGSNVLSAFVEIIFDNSDGRLPVDKKEVVLRRAIGVKKDEYFLNRRHVSKSDVVALLESAGFSRSNPYYCVRQGKVNKLCSMKDKERLELLKEVAGTSVYEKRRQESLKIMRDTNNRREKIDEVIVYIEKRLGDLEEEKEELGKYQELDRERRAIEYTLYDLDFQNAGERLEQIKELRTEESEKANNLHSDLTAVEAHMDEIEQKMKFAKATIEETAADIESLSKDHSAKLQERTAAELEVGELEDRTKSAEESRTKLIHERDNVLAPQIRKARRELEDKVKPRVRAASTKVKGLEVEAKRVGQRLQCLYEKMGRSKTFKTAEERDAWINTELRDIARKVSAAKTQKQQHERDVESLGRDVEAQEKRHIDLTDEKNACDAEYRKISTAIQEKKKERNGKIEERRVRWKRTEELSKERKKWTDRLQRARVDQSKSCPRNLLDGIAAVRRITKEKKLKGVLGPLIENFSLATEKMLLPVESTVGNQLFNVIVEREATAAALMKVLVKEKTGRVTFMPLDVVREKIVEPPETRDAFPLLSKLKYDPRISAVMSRIFGRTLVCRDKTTALKFSKNGWTCVTLDGEVFNSKGNMSGGYYNMSLLRMRAQQSLAEAEAKLQSINAEHGKVESDIMKLDQEDAMLLGTIQKLESDRKRVLSKSAQIKAETERLETLLEALRGSLEQKSASIDVEETLKDLVAQKERLEAEIGTALASGLTRAEDGELRALTAKEKELTPLAARAEAELADVMSQETALRSKLEDDLERRAAEIEKLLQDTYDLVSSVDARERKVQLQDAQHRLDRVKRVEADLQARLEASRKQKSKLSSDVAHLSERRESVENELVTLRENLEDHAKRMEKLLNKRNLLHDKRDEAKRKISVLGSLPDKELKDFRDCKRRKLMNMLQERNAALKNYAHVNKKALAQFVSFSQQREDLINRKKQLDEGHEAIVELIDVLDRRKDEAIMRTFSDVAKHFEDVFKELVPHGSGRMVMLTSDDDDIENGAETKRSSRRLESKSTSASKTQDDLPPQSVSRFTGIAVQVAFNAGDKTATMETLSSRSGGQKALVALAIIFAIQRCDPAPFYVFDEIDQALDATHRAAVAALIQRQANAADGAVQFITSTFWPEQVEVASRFYGVALQHKVSEIHSMEKSEASRFVRELRAKESAVGRR